MKDFKPLDLTQLKTYSLFDRFSKVTVDHFAKPVGKGCTVHGLLDSLPDILLGRGFRELVDRLAVSHLGGRPIIIGMGAHVIKVGLSPLIIDLMERKVITGIALNGACIVHDTEVAMAGKTSEEVDQVLGSGAFGAAQETGQAINAAILHGAENDKGIGEAVGEYLLEQDCPHNSKSILASARRLGVPVTVHVAIGTDIIHIHPSMDGAATGKATHLDFKLFCALISELEGGAFINIGSAVLMPEVFLKALTVVRNLGHSVNSFTTANFDFIRQYRPATNVVSRPTAQGGKGFNITGHHELMIPLLAAALIERIGK